MTTGYNGEGGETEYYELYSKMMNDDDDALPCGCPTEHMWYDEHIGVYRCDNCGWCS